MKKKVFIALIFIVIGAAIGILLGHVLKFCPFSTNEAEKPIIKFDDTRKTHWHREFKVVEIKSSADSEMQKAYFYQTKSNNPKPLIVSLHTWSGDYSQIDGIAELCRKKDLNYIHPDFRGPNWTKNACCSNLALSDIDDAISFALNNSNVDTSCIYVIGTSGGGYASLSTFMKSKHSIRKFSAWVPISDLEAWYRQSKIRRNKYAQNVMDCCSSKDSLDIQIAREKSPLFMETPVEKLNTSKLYIHTGIYDGIQGSVPITHAINFYNKVLTDLNVQDKYKYVSDEEKLQLLEFRKPLGAFGSIADREICLQKEHENIKLVVFTGNHEMLTEYAFDELLAN